MVGWVRWTRERRFRPGVSAVRVLGFPLLAVDLPEGDPARRGRQAAKALARRGASRALLPPELGEAFPGVDPLPLCRAMGADLALAFLGDVPLRERQVVLRGEKADRVALDLADTLCPQVGSLYLDFDRGEEELAGYLRFRYGTPPHPPGRIPRVQLAVDLSPREKRGEPTLILWGRPGLLGLGLSLGKELPENLPQFPFLALLWENGWVKKEDILIVKP